MRRSDDDLVRRHFRKDAALLGQASREASTRPSIPEESGDAIDAASDLGCILPLLFP